MKNQSKGKKCTFLFSDFFLALPLKKMTILQTTDQRLNYCASTDVMALGSCGNRQENSEALVKVTLKGEEQNGLLVPVLRLFRYQ